MSGGSFGYIYSKNILDIISDESKLELLEEMYEELTRKYNEKLPEVNQGFSKVIDDIDKLIRKAKELKAQAETVEDMRESLSSVLGCFENWISHDSSYKSFLNECENYQETKKNETS